MKDFFIHQDLDNKVVVGGVMSLMDFAVEKIVLRVKGGLIDVCGKDLVIERFDENEITVIGKISGVLTNVTH
ncbi:MAG: YabP/YqfC family sporulation protein [Eubacteriales bacterium]|nr:YabP/YqfC family sporulation protein [Eubacteriales bacterium]